MRPVKERSRGSSSNPRSNSPAYCGRLSFAGRPILTSRRYSIRTALSSALTGSKKDRYLVRNPLQVLTAYQNGVENAVAFLANGILGAASRRSWTKGSARA
jgi:hypothetical protein